MKSLHLTHTVQAVLLVLAQNHQRDMYGGEITQACGVRAGTVYPILIRMRDAGWVEDRWERESEKSHGRPPRHYYRLRPAAVRDIQKMLSWGDKDAYRMPGLAESMVTITGKE